VTIVAVTGANSMLGKAVLEQLDADDTVSRILGVDVSEPEMPVAKLELRTADVRDPLLAHALRDADVVVHLAATRGPDPDDDTAFAVNVHGTRHVLDAAEKVEARSLVHLSSAAVYGAHPDNPVPLDEEAPLRANPDFGLVHQQLLAEELVSEWAAAHPDCAGTVLRPALTLGPGQDDSVTRWLELPRLPAVRGYAPPWQFVHVDDVAAAVHLAATGGLRGAYNVAADGWLSADEVSALVGRRLLPLPETVAFTTAARLWRRGLLAAPPGAVHYLLYPCIVSPRKLEEAGWSPTRSNRELLREFSAEHHGYVALGRLRVRRRDVYVSGLVAAAILAIAAAKRRR
jgi:UDP-glucose 4-epimerase